MNNSELVKNLINMKTESKTYYGLGSPVKVEGYLYPGEHFVVLNGSKPNSTLSIFAKTIFPIKSLYQSKSFEKYESLDGRCEYRVKDSKYNIIYGIDSLNTEIINQMTKGN